MLNMWKVRELVDKATNVVMNYSEIESKVREATNDDPWGPSGQLMGEIAKATFMYEQFPEVMNMLWTRMLKDNKKNWRRVYKVGLPHIVSVFPEVCSGFIEAGLEVSLLDVRPTYGFFPCFSREGP
ncbi:PREDICTED: clathrin interactor 1-like [Poecilia mexicana]|uniref:ENTH domain-containing protein n=1 Tax=Poecilia mexicana TaxID=48701 RepID=A0A3B3Y9R9_9TELE|nr:PREDICTED: clathrin interactor 1-like [Poecilia mexicana]XP_014835511.1 PREDICTED: clathrin interactor 1-like [Poecilia mexicana]XP_016522927.1 PREDICTED: clathrin interactor 1-like [Poecilia formosa]